MATHSTAYVPTNRAPNEYIMIEGWSDGMLSSTGFSWYQSTPRLDESIRAVMLIDGSPVFAPAGSNALEVKEFDYIEENVSDMLDEDERADNTNEANLDSSTPVDSDSCWTEISRSGNQSNRKFVTKKSKEPPSMLFCKTAKLKYSVNSRRSSAVSRRTEEPANARMKVSSFRTNTGTCSLATKKTVAVVLSEP